MDNIINANEILKFPKNNVLLFKRQMNSTSKVSFTFGGFLNEARNEVLSITKVNPIILFMIGGFIISLVIFYLYARKNYPKGRSAIIFTFTLFAVDMCLDIAFLLNNVMAVPSLFLPSLIALLGPAGFNILFAFVIMIQQTCNSDRFSIWICSHGCVATVFTLFSAFHIEVLRLLTSNFLHSNVFNAPFSCNAKKYLFIAGLFNVIIEDLPQFIILVNTVFQGNRDKFYISTIIDVIRELYKLIIKHNK
ncbi:12538_t:CDS:2 [Funneliformis geosporum]|uniref:16371_t:CDS:1 n=1 Tax=Funneliformis geosporum TaxID=1117311 RepID=A0A9W4SRI4_9GLOM|nr:12538_t:CDS:2 [Funneliformis geosporum]CAI2177861.1 16371_t:CDS:2 [Funneliformis geosporum]